MRRFLITLGAVVGVLVLGCAPAFAEPPLRLVRQLTDQVGALSGREARVEQELSSLRTTSGVVLYVVYVSTFLNEAETDWATSTAHSSSLGRSDVLLAIAVDTRTYQWWTSDSSPLSTAQLSRMLTTEVEPAVSQGDWAGAAIGAAQGLHSVAKSDAAPWSPTATAAVVAVTVVVLFVGHVLSPRPARSDRRQRQTGRTA